MSGPPSLWLDVTRIVSRTGREPFTGIDRVELGWLDGLLARDLALFGFARTATGFVLLDRAGLAGLWARIAGAVPWGAPDLPARLSRRLSPARKRAEADLRRLSVARCLRPGLGRFLRRHLAPGTWLLNVGHSNLSGAVLGQVASAGGRIAVMVHDTIPLDLSALHRPGMVESFAERMRAVAAHAALVVTPSAAAAARIRAHLGVTAVVAPPGLDPVRPDPVALYDRIDPAESYFVSVGTIDGRKNQTLLLDLWDRLGAERPTLYLCGSRGWCPPDLERRLDAPPAGVVELAGLGDGALAALVEGAAGLLHPSLAEGFGYPLLEAALLGVPVVAADLPVYRETLGDIGVYLKPDDLYHWKETTRALAAAHRRGEQYRAGRPKRPTWDAHLNLVLSLM